MVKSKLAVWSFVLVIVATLINIIFVYLVIESSSSSSFSLTYLIFPFLILYIASFILGIGGLVAINKNKNLTGKRFAIIAVVLSIIVLMFGIYLWFFWDYA